MATRTRYVLPWLALLLGCGPAGDSPGSPASNQHGATTPVSADGSPAAAEKATAATAPWPQWRGPDANGISPEKAWRTNWRQQPPQELWRKQLGVGYSAFSVAGGRAYSLGYADGQETIWCLDAATGQKVWSHSYPGDLNDNLHTGGPAASPTVQGDRVYTLGKSGQLFCLNSASGKVIWQQDLPQLLDVPVPEWGFSCSPLLVDGKLFIDAGRTVALAADSGKLLWQTEPFRAGYGTPAAFTLAGEALLAVLNNDALLILRQSNGQTVARRSWTTDFSTTSTTPIVVGNRIFISTGYNNGCALFELADGELKTLYRNRVMSNHMNNCVLWEGHLYGFDGNSHNARTVRLVCMDWETGKEKWAERGLGCGSLILADGKLIALSDDGRLVIIPARPQGYEVIAEHQVLEETCWTPPVLAAGRIYCRNDAGSAACVDVSGE